MQVIVAYRSLRLFGAYQGCLVPGGGVASRRQNPYSSLHAQFPGARAASSSRQRPGEMARISIAALFAEIFL
jgi:hypothetical protein